MKISDIFAFDELIDVYQCAQKDGNLHERAAARQALKDAYRAALAAAPTPPADVGEREAFEAWYLHDLPREVTCFLNRSPQHPDMYDDDSVEDAWTGWQARASLAKPAQVTLTDEQLDAAVIAWFSYERYQDDFRTRMRAAIEATKEQP